jgi:hypothetical protein
VVPLAAQTAVTFERSEIFTMESFPRFRQPTSNFRAVARLKDLTGENSRCHGVLFSGATKAHVIVRERCETSFSATSPRGNRPALAVGRRA